MLSSRATNITAAVCVCVCSLPIYSRHQVCWTYQPGSPAGVTQEEDHTGFFIHLLSAVPVLIFFAKRIHPFLSLVTVMSNFVHHSNDLIVLHPLGIFFLFFIFYFSEKNPVYRDRTHVPTCQKFTRLPLSYRGDSTSTAVTFNMPTSYQ